MAYNICSNPTCKYSGNISPGEAGNPAQCPTCGANLWYSCPHCKGRTFDMRNQKFCPQCRKEIKPRPAPPGREDK
jgi:hypothetical protein